MRQLFVEPVAVSLITPMYIKFGFIAADRWRIQVFAKENDDHSSCFLQLMGGFSILKPLFLL